MRGGACFFVVAALLAPPAASAQMQPHRAEYALRLGTAANAPRIGTAVQDITLDCNGWHITRDVSSEIAFTPSLKVNLASRLDGDEARGGDAFRYHTVQTQNGSARDTRGKVQRADGETRAEIVSSGGSEQVILPPPTLMPVATLSHLIDRLSAKAAMAPTLLFGAEAMGDVFQVEVTEIDGDTLRAAPPALKPVAVPAARFWPLLMTFTRALDQAQKPLFSVRAMLFSSGVLDRLTVDNGVATVTADLQALEMHKAPVCSGS
jgi:hypothetical protein